MEKGRKFIDAVKAFAYIVVMKATLSAAKNAIKWVKNNPGTELTSNREGITAFNHMYNDLTFAGFTISQIIDYVDGEAMRDSRFNS